MRYVADRDASDYMQSKMDALVLPYTNETVCRIDCNVDVNYKQTRIVHIDINEVEWMNVKDPSSTLHVFDYGNASTSQWIAMTDEKVAWINLVKAMAEMFLWEYHQELGILDDYRAIN